MRTYRVRPNSIQHDHAVCAVWSAYSVSIVHSAVAVIMAQSVPDCAVIVQSCGRLLARPCVFMSYIKLLLILPGQKCVFKLY